MLSHTSHIFKVDRNTLQKYSSISKKYDALDQKYFWAFVGRFPYLDMDLIYASKELVQKFWHENTISSSNQRDVPKLRKGINECEPHVKHFLDMT